MSKRDELMHLFDKLAPDEQGEVIDFVEFLQQKKAKLIPEVQLVFGSLPGLVESIADDFDAPLDDFADYM
ncbi:MAG: DUF2281 domain-containing protein [Candidatus Sericytochromatia bacterium]